MHRNIHKLTCMATSSNGRDHNQIDHLMVSSMWRRSLLDVRVKRGANASSDRNLVTAKVTLKLREQLNQTNTTPLWPTAEEQVPSLE